MANEMRLCVAIGNSPVTENDCTEYSDIVFLPLPATKETLETIKDNFNFELIKTPVILFISSTINSIERDFEEAVNNSIDNLDELNYLAYLLNNMDEHSRNKLAAITDMTCTYESEKPEIKDIINLAYNLHCFDYYPLADTYESLGFQLFQENVNESIPEEWENFIDFKSFGTVKATFQKSYFSEYGYIGLNENRFIEVYNGKRVPKELRITHMLKEYKGVIPCKKK